MDELLPCPFCGEELKQIFDKTGRPVGWEHSRTYDCVLGTLDGGEPLYVSPDEKELWNTRTPKGEQL